MWIRHTLFVESDTIRPTLQTSISLMTNTQFHTIPALHPSWQSILTDEFSTPSTQNLLHFLEDQALLGKSILPAKPLWFNALNSTAFDQVKIVILGQDPYPTAGHAHGLSFSVMPDVKPLPRSLQNINKELLEDLGIDNSHSGHLQAWADQGVLLLNTVLTVEEGNAGAHQRTGWEAFTQKIIEALNHDRDDLVFVLWGKQAQKHESAIDPTRHLIIASAHPSPLSARRGFFGSKPFSRINEHLENTGKTTINWQLP
ncbi:MAG: Uracil-DNA glycosylase, family 1 [uncultured Thiotrichaceae bacterium]|uniref:Uracil-DNA glycosylase n=1 Tax=uncultured Thiotrichaceae bacterium TaxID=298394 RepID=A0A6S6U793_9GAMM|nr:MAG: Uracil-DNA glycosylase, family 1 [uncultured Thiotrichaceae bacterium]